ncbi:MAG: hypothetical protein CME65_03650 [Halobacteriovoraceae bacterium]|nr:hypothetical protein [Halobacteriovoraceae bacterium]
MEKYIIIAHPESFVRKALSAFLTQVGFGSYQLEVDDDLLYKKQDLDPKGLVIHRDFKHNSKSVQEIIELFGVKSYELGETVDPQSLAGQIKRELESH